MENLLPPDGTELFKYQILVDHLKLEDTEMIADANLNFPTPFTDTMSAVHEKYGQPHQLALRRIASVIDSPDVRQGDIPAFQRSALQVQSLVGLLRTLGHDGELELSSGSHVARLLNKLPLEQREEFHRHMFRQPGSTPNLVDFSNWLCYETSCHSYDAELMPKSSYAGKRSIAILHGVGTSSAPSSSLSPPTVESVMPRRALQSLPRPTSLSPSRREHQSFPYGRFCYSEKSCSTSSSPDRFYLDKPSVSGRVMLKVVPVHLSYEDCTLDTFALMDDGSERTILHSAIVEALGIQGVPEDLPLQTVRDDVQVICGRSIAFQISPVY
ncbi:guanine nucleotide-binding subunit alpha-12 isoform X2 [Labeo rohita]|uniref:Guanine nucleotide-binding subunit alpha-12 isoform X2 n=1 Tax=Labeo rohita TaxID=84645 RepID=A0A498NP24_LABRO|nr:guanine nucleotide-binding subunit alpha-12 isoform X2 [Labeo rohita]